MRAICEACTKPQPTAWKPGDLCIHCGQSVRHDVRCFWCTTWTPAAKYCRSCGAECVDERHYGAARMIKDAGTDRFTVPKMLRELDPEQIENFTRIYQRQAAIIARHVDDLRWLECHLHHQSFSTALEDELIPQLPWDKRTVDIYTPQNAPVGDDLAIANGLLQTSPIQRTQDLARLVSLTLGDYSEWASCIYFLHHGDERVRDEAALALSHWRVQALCGLGEHKQLLIALLHHSPHHLDAAVRLATLSPTPIELPYEVLTSNDPDVQFAIALIKRDQDHLIAALDESDAHVIAAGQVLVRLNITAPLERLIRDGSEQVRSMLIDAVWNNVSATNDLMPAPPLNRVLMELAERATDWDVRRKAIFIVWRAIPPGWALRLLRANRGDFDLDRMMITEKNLSDDERSDVLTYMMDSGELVAGKFHQRDNFFAGIPKDFVLTRFSGADHARRKTLCELASGQLRVTKDRDILRFLVHILYGDHLPELKESARRGCAHLEGSRSDLRDVAVTPLILESNSICHFYGSIASFLPHLIASLKAVTEGERNYTMICHFSDLLDHHDAAIVPHVLAHEAHARDLLNTLLLMGDDKKVEPSRYSAIRLLGAIGNHPRWRDEVIAHLQARMQAKPESEYLSNSLKDSLQALTGIRPT